MSSVQHAAEGNPMFDIYGNPPAHPVLLRQPAPVDKDKERDSISSSISANKELILIPKKGDDGRHNEHFARSRPDVRANGRLSHIVNPTSRRGTRPRVK